MDSSRIISLRYNETIACASELNELASDLRALASKAKDDLRMVSVTWRGETADLYRQKLEREAVLVEERAKALADAADALKRSAESTYRAEMYALSLLGG